MVNGYFLGRQISLETADKLALQRIKAAWLQEDLELMDKKFWDYKMWHPTIATAYFVSEYWRIAHDLSLRTGTRSEQETIAKIGASYNIIEKAKGKNYTSFIYHWRARMMADAIGCTYRAYIKAAILHFRDYYRDFPKKRKQLLPHPNQLYSEAVVKRAIKEWTLEKGRGFPLPENEDIPFNNNLWFRPEMETWLYEEAGRHEFGKFYIKKAIENGIILTPRSE